nr:PAS domain S-box protein [Bradyrhizobium symbiodeficiens]
MVVVAGYSSSASFDRLTHEFSLKDVLDSDWAVRPIRLERDSSGAALVLEDPGGEPLAKLLDSAMEIDRFLRLAIGITQTLGKLHRSGLVHRDIKPANIMAGCADGRVRLTGFGLASQLPRERQTPGPPDTIAGTLAYIAPEQTGRMNRSIDARSDLYALGITFYQMLTGVLPFTASNPMGWVHCHIARMPVAPHERSEGIPAPVSLIIMKLLAKTPEERYQTAGGVEVDLRRCLAEWEARRSVGEFGLGKYDIPDRLLIPEKLYGRDREISSLLACLDRVTDTGGSEFVLVSGYSGIGKSSVVNELHRTLVRRRIMFASGKAEKLKRDIPYGALAQAFHSLVRPLLGKSDTELAIWRRSLLDALEANGQIMIDLIPDLKLIVGDQPVLAELPPQQAQSRLRFVFHRFIAVFARPDHPLILFLDDLQWLDSDTLDLLKEVFTQSDLRHLLVIGAYRDSELAPTHPLLREFAAIQASGTTLETIALAPLAHEHLSLMIVDALRCDVSRADPLAKLIHDKTGGNPFFAIQFLMALTDEALLTFDHDAGRWTWELERIFAKGYTENIVDLLVKKLARLPTATQSVLQQFACLGNVAESATIAIVLSIAEDEVDTALLPARRQELVDRVGAQYRFVHDRIQDAAYSLIAIELRAETHLKIGRKLLANARAEDREKAIFDIVNQLNRGASLIVSAEERWQLAELNLLAGKSAKAANAYDTALNYFVAGAKLLPENGGEDWHELEFSLEICRAECEFLTRKLTAAERRLDALSARKIDAVKQANVACLLVDLYVTLDQSSRAVAVGLEYLRHVGIDWSPHPTREEASGEYRSIWSNLGGRQIDVLAYQPLLSNATSLATLEVLTRLSVPALYTDVNLLSLVASRAVNLSIENGNCDASSLAFSVLGFVAGPCFGDYEAGIRFGRVGLDLVEKRELKRFQARIYFNFGSLVIPWTRHVRGGREMLRLALKTANQTGDLNFEAYCYAHLNTNLLAAGDPLEEVQHEAERGLAFAVRMRFRLAIDRIRTQLGLIRSLRGLTPVFGTFDEEGFDEHSFEQELTTRPDLALAEGWYWIRKLQSRLIAGDYTAALEASMRAERFLWTSPSMFETAEYSFLAALAHAAACHNSPAAERQQHFGALVAQYTQLELWARHCTENFESRAALLGAEIARIDGRALDAMDLYEKAIRSAQDNSFVHIEALAYEMAAKFYLARGFPQIAQLYLQGARSCYLRWGADGKVRQLDAVHPHLRTEAASALPTGTIAASVEHLDLASVIKVSQAFAGERIMEKLLESLMRTAMEQAGAQRGLLVVLRGAEQRITAEATISADLVTIHMRDVSVDVALLPVSLLRAVLRTCECIILDDAVGQSPFAADPYVQQRSARSILCLPLLNQAKIVGALYLENNLVSGVFSPARTAVLKVLASQAAISLDNAYLYQELEEREARIRRLVDSNVIGIVIWDLDGRLLEANDAFLRMVQYDREELNAGLRWFDMTPPEWQEVHARSEIEELVATGTMQAREKEYFRKDGTRVPVLIGAAAFEGRPDQGVAYILDLTNLKRAEEAARESERRYRQVQAELAHANRVATIGQITGSIAHEVNQPITAAVIGAQAASRWLEHDPPDLEEVRRALARVVRNGTRAGDVVGRIRDLIKKVPPRRDLLEVNGLVREVVELTGSEANKNGVFVEMLLADDLPTIRGDGVQLQQVALNLIINAIEAMSAANGGPRRLLIRTEKTEANHVLVVVQDSGPGLASTTVERLFESFYTTKTVGLGMGLSICRSIIEAHGGQLWASANQPRGAVFRFTLPPAD